MSLGWGGVWCLIVQAFISYPPLAGGSFSSSATFSLKSLKSYISAHILLDAVNSFISWRIDCKNFSKTVQNPQSIIINLRDSNQLLFKELNNYFELYIFSNKIWNKVLRRFRPPPPLKNTYIFIFSGYLSDHNTYIIIFQI